MKPIRIIAAAFALVASAVLAADNANEGVALTIYNQNFAVVRETRKMEIKQNRDTLRFTDVAAQIDYTPKDETVKLKVGDAFDVVGERKRTNFHVDNGKHEMTETIEISVRNRQADPIEVLVKETLYRGANWEILNPNHPFKKFDAQITHFPVKIEKESEQTITYTAHYTW